MTARAEDGSATVINLALIACLLAIGLALSAAAIHLCARAYAHGAADLAAVAAAQDGACSAAQEVLGRNHSFRLLLTRCEIRNGFAQVEVRRPGPVAVVVTSRAGPVW